ncbi:hypothetical protein OG777_25755 [Micromonospora peucetia]|uniref:Uncharacterized protein n=2 Tax=Micromonospora peucetia TaxID=47871 RepID=A0ABZ1EC34_9ACTN|nr:hypothetical protein [Micromonospora peucetia]MCX4390303.1 hypothetical protein [Micromonospora peucetia]WSA32393.1 hypothetical protein OIE14_30570 [Micromonospora peucetia]
MTSSVGGAIMPVPPGSRTSTDPAHLDAQRQLDRQGGAAELAAMYDRLLAVVATRPGTRVVRTEHGRADEAYRRLLACLT